MPIIQERFWVVKCDGCGEYLSTREDIDYECWRKKPDKETIEFAEWEVEDWDIICEQCLRERAHKKDHEYSGEPDGI